MLNGAPHFQVSAVTNLAARDDLVFVTLQLYSLELNSVEECWRQLQAAISKRFFDSLDELPTAIETGPRPTLDLKMSNYFQSLLYISDIHK